MTLGQKLKSIRRECGVSQEAIGAQGFVSTPGWIKVENGQRSPSEQLIGKLVGWLVKDKYVPTAAAKDLQNELLTLKYLASSSAFVRDLAMVQAKQLPQGKALLTRPKTGASAKRARLKLAPVH